MNKRGLSPVIATTLLIVIALILAMIIYLWARGFLQEQNMKFGEVVENSCKNIKFQVDASSSVVKVSNQGNIPIYNFEIFQINSDSKISKGAFGCNSIKTLNPGEYCELKDSNGLSGNLSIVPVVLGNKGGASEPYTCAEYGMEVEVNG